MVFVLLFLLCMGMIAEFISLHKGVKQIKFQYKPGKDLLEQGEEIPVAIEASNTGLLPAGYVLAKAHFPIAAQIPEGVVVERDQFQQTVNMVFRLWGRQSRRRNVSVRIDKRGVHYFRGAMVEGTDFLGMRKTWDFVDQQEQVLIYPRCIENGNLISAMGEFYGDMVAQRHLLRDPVLTMGVREYTGSDPMKTISWSQSARRNQLMVREFDFIRDMSCTVLLAADGMMPTQVERLDHCCSIARTVCQEMADRGVNVEFSTNSPIEGFGSKKHAVWKCTATAKNQQDLLRGLALLYPGPVGCAADVLAVSAARAAGRKTAFVVVAVYENDAVLKAVRLLEEYSGMRVLFVKESDYYSDRNGGKE